MHQGGPSTKRADFPCWLYYQKVLAPPKRLYQDGRFNKAVALLKRLLHPSGHSTKQKLSLVGQKYIYINLVALTRWLFHQANAFSYTVALSKAVVLLKRSFHRVNAFSLAHATTLILIVIAAALPCAIAIAIRFASGLLLAVVAWRHVGDCSTAGDGRLMCSLRPTLASALPVTVIIVLPFAIAITVTLISAHLICIGALAPGMLMAVAARLTFLVVINVLPFAIAISVTLTSACLLCIMPVTITDQLLHHYDRFLIQFALPIALASAFLKSLSASVAATSLLRWHLLFGRFF